MKKHISIIASLILLVGLVKAQVTTPLNLKGTVINGYTGTVYLQRFDNKIFRTIDSVKVKGGTFEFHNKIRLPELYGLSFNTARTPLYVFLDKNPITVALDSARSYNASNVTGSALQDEFNAFKRERNVNITEYIKAHPASLVTAYVLYRNYSYRLTPEQIDQNVQLLDASLANTPYVQFLKEFTGVLNKVAVGKKAPDFTGITPAGKEIRLSEHYHKYTLIDFWASWCGPCRKENPNVVAAYQKFKNKGFSVFGVSLDKSKAGWVKAIETDHLDWDQVSELKYWESDIAKQYGVRAIPANFLIDDKGIIVGKNLRGEELVKKLDELLSE